MLAPAALAAAAGFAQFAATASLADVAAAFGVSGGGGQEVPGLSDTTLGIGLGIIRLGSLAAMPLAATADHIGRRKLVLGCTTVGLALTAAASLAAGFWWFVVILALARPLLSATNAVALVICAEVTSSRNRSRAVSVVGATYGIGAGAIVLLRAAAGEGLGFRPLFALALVPLALLPLLARSLKETGAYQNLDRTVKSRPRWRRSVPADLRRRLVVLGLLTGAAAMVSGPATTFVFYFSETVRGMSPAPMAAAVLAAGPIGLLGLIAGRWGADNLGRRLSSALSMAVLAGAAIVTYGVGGSGVIGGYLLAIFAASAFTPPSGAMSSELFPTSFRSTAAGWLTAAGVLGAVVGLSLFGFLADSLGNFGVAATLLAVPVALLTALYLLLPETAGMELDDSAPEPGMPPLTQL
ncbi:MAG TPA: MFS transporter [Actinomycetota bacterium]|nr:MFS transporter [Actinomycetota bacterium]